jgi:hypothetical protein
MKVLWGLSSNQSEGRRAIESLAPEGFMNEGSVVVAFFLLMGLLVARIIREHREAGR